MPTNAINPELYAELSSRAKVALLALMALKKSGHDIDPETMLAALGLLAQQVDGAYFQEYFYYDLNLVDIYWRLLEACVGQPKLKLKLLNTMARIRDESSLKVLLHSITGLGEPVAKADAKFLITAIKQLGYFFDSYPLARETAAKILLNSKEELSRRAAIEAFKIGCIPLYFKELLEALPKEPNLTNRVMILNTILHIGKTADPEAWDIREYSNEVVEDLEDYLAKSAKKPPLDVRESNAINRILKHELFKIRS